MSDIATQLKQVAATAAETASIANDLEARVSGGIPIKSYYEEVFNEGKEAAERERFEVLQDGGKATEYREMFAGRGWTDDNFKPIYDIKPNQNKASRMFAFSGIKNLKADLERQGVKLDLSGITGSGVSQLFANSLVTNVGVLDISNATDANHFLLDAAQLVSVEKVILSSKGNQTFTSAFNQCRSLVEIRFEGVIGNNVDFKACTNLTNASLKSILSVLTKDEAKATGKTCTLATVHKTAIQADAELENLYTACVSKGWIFTFAN